LDQHAFCTLPELLWYIA